MTILSKSYQICPNVSTMLHQRLCAGVLKIKGDIKGRAASAVNRGSHFIADCYFDNVVILTIAYSAIDFNQFVGCYA